MPLSGSAASRISMARSWSVMRGMDAVSFVGFRPGWMGLPGLGEERADFLVARLREVLVPEAHRAEGLRGRCAHHLVGERAHLLAGFRRGGGHRDDDARW